MENNTRRDAVARAIAAKMIEQNHMLELIDRDGRIEIYDDYDNKSYDCRELADAAIETIPPEDMPIRVLAAQDKFPLGAFLRTILGPR